MPAFLHSATRFVSGRLLPRIAYPVMRGPLAGMKFILGAPAGEGGGASVFFGTVEPEQTKVLTETLSAGDVFFDIGANIGYYSLLAGRLVGPRGVVVAVEPVVRNLSFLYRHLELNRLRNVRVIPAACSSALS